MLNGVFNLRNNLKKKFSLITFYVQKSLIPIFNTCFLTTQYHFRILYLVTQINIVIVYLNQVLIAVDFDDC